MNNRNNIPIIALLSCNYHAGNVKESLTRLAELTSKLVIVSDGKVFAELPNFDQRPQNEIHGVRSVNVGLNSVSDAQQVMIMHIDSESDLDDFPEYDHSESTAFYKKQTEKYSPSIDRKLGIIFNGGYLDSLFYQLPDKWLNDAIYLTGKPLTVLREICKLERYQNLLPYEIIQMIVDDGHQIKVVCQNPDDIDYVKIKQKKKVVVEHEHK